MAHPTRFERVAFAFGGVALYPTGLRAQCLAVQRPNESNPLGVCCDIVKPVFSTTLYDAAPVRERDVVRQPIDRSTLHWRSLVTWRGSFAERALFEWLLVDTKGHFRRSPPK